MTGPATTAALRRFKPQLWARVVDDPEMGEVQQFIQHAADGQWYGWEIYHADNAESAHVSLGDVPVIPLGFREITP